MADQPDMLTAIEQATLTRLTDKIPALKSAGVQKDSRQLLRDISVAVACLSGKFNKIGQAIWRNECTVSVLLKFKNMQSEEARRKGINPLVVAAVQILLGQKLGLAIGPLHAVMFRDVTSEEKYDAGVIEYLLEFSTWFDIRQLEEEALGDLITMAIDYLLKPGDDAIDASDTLTTTV
ncbi:MAG: DUF1834 family protein [Geobacteraceae bacterium]|nr:DUF1834 family protein [Geobacteraceae bacterium]